MVGITIEHLAACRSPRGASRHLAHCTQSTAERISSRVSCIHSHRPAHCSSFWPRLKVWRNWRDASACMRRGMPYNISGRGGRSRCGNASKSWMVSRETIVVDCSTCSTQNQGSTFPARLSNHSFKWSYNNCHLTGAERINSGSPLPSVMRETRDLHE